LPTEKSSAPIQRRWPALEKMMGWWFCGEVLMVVVLEKVKEKVKALVEFVGGLHGDGGGRR